MMNETILTNAVIVTATDAFPGSVVVRDGAIATVERGRSTSGGAIDLEGDYLLPGLVELHTDNLEKHVAPRPGVRWPMRGAVLAHDAQVAAAGITTVFDALTVCEVRDNPVRADMLQDAAATIGAAQREGLLRAQHFLHMRCEVGHAEVVEVFQTFLDNPLLGLVSLMDHTPGQRQFASIDKYFEYYEGKFGYSRAEMGELVERRLAEQEIFAARRQWRHGRVAWRWSWGRRMSCAAARIPATSRRAISPPPICWIYCPPTMYRSAFCTRHSCCSAGSVLRCPRRWPRSRPAPRAPWASRIAARSRPASAPTSSRSASPPTTRRSCARSGARVGVPFDPLFEEEFEEP
jgi:hypothetical protein